MTTCWHLYSYIKQHNCAVFFNYHTWRNQQSSVISHTFKSFLNHLWALDSYFFFFTVCIQNTLLSPCGLLVLSKIRYKQFWLQISLIVSEDAKGTIPQSSVFWITLILVSYIYYRHKRTFQVLQRNGFLKGLRHRPMLTLYRLRILNYYVCFLISS